LNNLISHLAKLLVNVVDIFGTSQQFIGEVVIFLMSSCLSSLCTKKLLKSVILLTVGWDGYFEHGHAAHKDDTDWVKGCLRWEVEGVRQRIPEKDSVGLC